MWALITQNQQPMHEPSQGRKRLLLVKEIDIEPSRDALQEFSLRGQMLTMHRVCACEHHKVAAGTD
jgi:hypothetical protein